MIKIEHHFVIRQPTGKVFASLIDFANEPSWQKDLLESRATSEDGVRIGTKVTQVRKFFRQRVETIGEIVEFEPGHKMVSKSAPENPPPSFTTTYLVEAENSNSHVFYSIELQGKGFFNIIEPLIKRNIEKDVVMRFATLKRLLEN